MGYVDSCDRSINKYSIARNYSHARWIRRYIDSFYDFGLNNTFALYYEYWSSKLDSTEISDELRQAILARKSHKYFITQVAIGLLTDREHVSLPSLVIAPFRTAFNSVKNLLTSRARCKMSKCNCVTKYRCNECKKAYCDDHSTRICRVCYENKSCWKFLCLVMRKKSDSLSTPNFLLLCYEWLNEIKMEEKNFFEFFLPRPKRNDSGSFSFLSQSPRN